MRINSFKFGDIVIDGHHNQDVKIYKDGTIKRWDYHEHHIVTMDDVIDLIDDDVDFFVIGIGEPGYCKVDKKVTDFLEQKNIRYFMRPTADAVNKINMLADKSRRFAAILHSTC